MQPDLEHDMQVVASLHNTQYENPLSAIEHPLQEMTLSAAGLASIPQEVRGWQRVWQWKPSQTVWRLSLLIGDSILLIGLFVVVLSLAKRFHAQLGTYFYEFGGWDSKLVWGCLALVTWGIAVSVTQAQEMSTAISYIKSPLCALFALISTLILLTLCFYHFIVGELFPYAKTLALFLILAVPVFCLWRVLLAEVLNLPPFHLQAVIIGWNKAGVDFAKELHRVKRSGLTVLGYICNDAEHPQNNDDLQNTELPVLGDNNALRNLTQSGKIDMLIIAHDYNTTPELFQAAYEAAQQKISLVPLTIAYERISGKIPVEYITDQWYVALPSEHSVSPLYLCWQKIVDLIGGLIGLLILCFALPVIALFIYLNSPGPIFYSQERVGLRGKPFRIYKFRSMRADAEQNGDARWASENDARVTRVGRFIRACHLDELPQALNILRGDMSLIGPRPEREEFVFNLEKNIPFYRSRLAVKPGLTGWAQVKYHYGSTDADALIKLQYDLYYVKRRSFMLDIFIILMTFVEVFLHRGI
jgi:exopolysaccharide biosynthesis polyprenyl glycosylphosphotransferase